MMGFSAILNRVWRAKRPDQGQEIRVIDPFDGPVYVIGDVHGCLPEYQMIEAAIAQDCNSFARDAVIVLLGDIIDRGSNTAALIDHLVAQNRRAARVICLRGNHEEMMLEFLENPKQNLDWLGFGGYETLASYGLFIDMARVARLTARELSQMVAAHIPDAHIRYLRQTIPAVQVGPYLLAHAGADANSSLALQSRRALFWGDAGQVAPAGLTLVHGHYIVAAPHETGGRMSIDTGAYLTGRLSCLRLMDGRRPAYFTTKDCTEFADLPIL